MCLDTFSLEVSKWCEKGGKPGELYLIHGEVLGLGNVSGHLIT